MWHHGRLKGTLVSALVAATAGRVHPNRSVGDRKAFEQFLDRGVFQRFSVEFRGNCRPVHSVFYKWFRNEMVHEGSLPLDIEFMPDSEPGLLEIRAGGAPEYVLKGSHDWFQELIHAVVTAPVNADLFVSAKPIVTQPGTAADVAHPPSS